MPGQTSQEIGPQARRKTHIYAMQQSQVMPYRLRSQRRSSIVSHSSEVLLGVPKLKDTASESNYTTYHSHQDKLVGRVSTSSCRPLIAVGEFNRQLTSTACTGGSRLLSFFTPTFIKEKNNWEAATSINPTLPSTTSRARLANSEVRDRL